MKVTDKIEITNEDNMALMSRYEDNYFDLAIVDPPYGIKRLTSGGMPKSSGFKKWDRKEWDNETPNKEFFNELFRVSKNQIVWGGNYMTQFLEPSMGWIFWFKQTGMTFADGELAWTSFNKATRCYDKSGMGGQGRIHPTQKPKKLYDWILKKYAKEGDRILDTHLGSGSIALACHERGFELTACELDKEYYNASIKRIKDHISQKRLF